MIAVFASGAARDPAARRARLAPGSEVTAAARAMTKSVRSGLFCTGVIAVLMLWSGYLVAAEPQPARTPSRGEMLYSTDCIVCHSAQVHEREKKVAVDWKSLETQVRRWHGVAGLAWSEDDIAEVTRYLNAVHYQYPVPK